MEEVVKQLTKIISQEFGVDVRPRVEPSEHADFASNVAMQIAKQVERNPRAVGEKLAASLAATGIKVEVAGPGFLNFTLADSDLVAELVASVERPDEFYKCSTYQDKVVVTEFSDPNPFKVLHVGHLYTSVVGNAISNLIERAGGKVHRVNFGGDVGLHVAKTMWAIKQQLGEFDVVRLPSGEIAERMDWIAARYVEGTNAYEDSEAAKTEIVELNKAIYQLTAAGDHSSDVAQVYWQCRAWSYEYFDAFYARMQVEFEKYYPESETAGLGLETVRNNIKAGGYEESDGAVVFKGEPYGLHTRVFINKEGLPTYEAKDVGLLQKKWQDYQFDLSVVITGADITEYMKVVLKSVEQFAPTLSERTRHIVHGNVKLAGGVKMSSRKGNFLRAVEVLDMVAAEQRTATGAADEVVVLGAVKYALLKPKIEPGEIIFSVKESVSLQGDSGPYLQYSLARAKSILRGVAEAGELSGDLSSFDLDEFERALLLALLEWRQVLGLAVDELAPHRVCTYIYKLAQKFSRFYENDRVAGSGKVALRQKLVQGYVQVLEECLAILGVPSVERI
ncbi:MAG: arginine--tRNA ligase [Candidatus Nomurabacteria bacterium]|jgi:arginyl-tRNA synthetase|nr:arginine--tRNA ligase [Candidatus Nomurabacteria bacterium]